MSHGPASEAGPDGAGLGSLWESHADWWQAGFTEGADAEYAEQILPMVARELGDVQASRILDIGTGEGQIARLTAAHAADVLPAAGPVAPTALVVGVDPTWAQIAEARRRDPAGHTHYARAGAGALPFPDGAFDTAIACLVFEHIEDVDAAIAEVGRVLDPERGRFLFFLNHPLLQTPNSGWIDDTILDEQYWRIGPYLVEDLTVEEVEKDVFIPFIHRPLSRYVNALADAGLVVTRMEEPAPPPGFLARAEEYAEAATIPRLLFLRCERLGATIGRR